MAHKNYRRKNPRISFKTTPWHTLPQGTSRWHQRQAWRLARRTVNRLIGKELYDDIPSKYPHHIRWDYW